MRRPATKSKPISQRSSVNAVDRSRFPVWLMAVLLVLVTIALYWPATGYDFVNYDDDVYVTSNAHVQSGLSWESIKWAFVELCGRQLAPGDVCCPTCWTAKCSV